MANKQTPLQKAADAAKPKAHKSINLNKAKKTVYKLAAAVTLTAAAYSAFYSLIANHTTNVPKAVVGGISAAVTGILVLVLATNDCK